MKKKKKNPIAKKIFYIKNYMKKYSIKILPKKISKWAGPKVIHLSLTENPFNKPIIDRCINCGDQEEAQATTTMGFGEGNLNTGSICRKCYSIHKGPKIALF